MRQKIYTMLVSMFVAALVVLPSAAWSSGEMFGGITFVGDRKGVCISIKGECLSAIDFQLETCDTNLNSKERYKGKMPFTLLVPVGVQQLEIKRNGKVVVNEPITIQAEVVLEYQLPE